MSEDCQQSKKRVQEYLKNELTETEMDAITAHVASCEQCESEYDFEVLFNSVIQRSCSEAPPEELAERVLQKIREQISKLA
jgi:anti-sigma factor (TIGR02949 family)